MVLCGIGKVKKDLPMPKIFFIVAHRPNRSPSQRFRFEQYLGYLKENGYDYDFSYLISEKEDRSFYRSGNLILKIYVVLKSLIKRSLDCWKANRYDIVFVQREAFMIGSVFFEKRFARSKAKLVYDFDDAIWMLDTSAANKKYEWLKDPGKTSKIIGMSDLVIAGNAYLATYAKQYNQKTVTIPTTVDTAIFRPIEKPATKDRICIGWSGSITTIKHFEFALPFLHTLKEKYGDQVYFKVIGDETYRYTPLDIQGIAWNSSTEALDMQEIDIGIMPLPDDEWAKGKCGLKGLLYMALEIPTLMSPVGVNTEIISHGVNGYLPANTEDWVEKISLLIESPAIRKQIGQEGRKTVIERFSVLSQQPNYLKYFNELLGRAGN